MEYPQELSRVGTSTTMKKKIIIRGPALSQTGYGEQTRFALRALRSREDIFDIYATYGESTKRFTNSQNGQLGLGCKSGFAYSNSFLVISYNKEPKLFIIVSLTNQRLVQFPKCPLKKQKSLVALRVRFRYRTMITMSSLASRKIFINSQECVQIFTA